MKMVLVTGAASGTGFAICERFAKEGWGVCLTSRNAEQAKIAALKIEKEYTVPAMGFGLIPGNDNAVETLFHTIHNSGHHVQALVLCAADLGIGQDTLAVPMNEFRSVIETNIVWNYFLCRNAALQMKEVGGGSIVFIGSNTTRRAIPNRAAYIASKGALTSLTKALAIDWGELNIRVNIILSGSIKTIRWSNQTEEWRQIRRDRAPIGDIADYEDIANAAYYLSSEQARVITGAELIVDGGVDAQYIPRL